MKKKPTPARVWDDEAALLMMPEENVFSSVRVVSPAEISEKPIAFHGQSRSKLKHELKMIGRQKNAADFLGTISPGFYVTGLTMGQFSLIDIIREVVAQIGRVHVTMSTWTVADADLSELQRMVDDGTFLSIRMLIDATFQKRQPTMTAHIRQKFGAESIVITRNHAKLLLISNEQYKIYCETSMNLNFNPRIETISLRDDPEIFDFFQKAMDLIFNHHGNQEGQDYKKALRQFAALKF